MDHAEFEKATAGMDVGITPWIQDLSEGLNGSASPRDLETLFQLAWLTFTAPHHDPAAFAAFRSRLEDAFANRAADPDAAFQDTLQMAMYQYHPRVWLATTANAARLDPDLAFAFYRDRFADAGDFTFFLVGAFDPDSLRPLVSQWLASLPAAGREESWRDAEIDPPTGVIEKTVRRGIEPTARTTIVFTGPLEWTPASAHAMSTLTEYLRIRLREVLREDLGGTYGVGVGALAQQWPDGEYRVQVGFGADPARIVALVDTLDAELAALRAGAVDDATVAKVREGQRRDLETNRRENGWWLGQLMARTAEGQELETIARKEELIERVSGALIVEAARQWLDPARRVQVTLLPEG